MADLPSADRTLPQPLPPVPIRDRPTAPLPASLTSFIGREHEVAQVTALLRRDGVRLATLTGPGGVGKTRLALRVAEELAPHFADGVAFVPLAAVTDPQLVALTVAHVLGVREVGERPAGERLADALREQHLVLLLDNVEHLLPAAALVTDLLRACPRLTVLATSRTTLRLSGEHMFPVPPLALPDPHRVATLYTASETEAVQLFVARARSALPSFALSDENAAAVAEVCRRLDGLPLAIELAAVRIPVLPPRALLARLERRLPLLTGGPRDAPERLQTVRGAIAWSYELLTAEEQLLFRRLAIFTGGCTLEAAEAVTAADGVDVLEGIASLVATSLVREDDDLNGEPRYRMLETIREYGLEQLSERGEEATIRRAHARYFVRLAEQVWAADAGTLFGFQMGRLLPERDNLRAALTWALAHDPALALLLAGTLDFYWSRANLFTEGRQWLTRALAAVVEAPPEARARALLARGRLALALGDFFQAEIDLNEGLSRAQALADEQLLARAHCYLFDIPLRRGDLDQARRLHAETLAHARLAGDPQWIAVAIMNAGLIALAMNDLPRAEDLLTEALKQVQRLGGPYPAAAVRVCLGEVALARGDAVRAAAFSRDALAAVAAASDWALVAENLDALAGATVASHPVPTVRLLGAADGMHARTGYPRDQILDGAYERTIATARTKLPDTTFTAAWAAGRELSQEAAVAEALALAAAVAAAVPARSPAAPHGLTPREWEVVRLVAAGHSNREVADALFISVPTVKRHLTTVLGKLGLSSRSALTAYAHTHGLV